MEKDYTSEIRIFKDFSEEERRLINDKIEVVEFRKGDIVFSEGEYPEAFYCLLSGRVRELGRDENANQIPVASYYHGDHVGEIAILSDNPYNTTLVCVNDALLIKLSKKEFLDLIETSPNFSRVLLKDLSVTSDIIRDIEERKVTIIGVCNLMPTADAAAFSVNIGKCLGKETGKNVVLLDFETFMDEEKAKAARKKGIVPLQIKDVDLEVASDTAFKIQPYRADGLDIVHVNANTEYLDELGKFCNILFTCFMLRYNFIIVNLNYKHTDICQKILEQTDVVYMLSDKEKSNLAMAQNLIMELRYTFGVIDKNIRFLLCDEGADISIEEREKIEIITDIEIFFVLPFVEKLEGSMIVDLLVCNKEDFSSSYCSAIKYLARDMAGNLIGLVLGSGAALGYAHIGVLKVIEEAGIPVDILVGCSMGALMGCFWAAGRNAEYMEAEALTFNKSNTFRRLAGMQDFSYGKRGLFKGKRVEAFIRSIIGDKTFKDLKIPFKVVATDLFTSEQIVLDKGRVCDAVRASISIPGIFVPQVIDGRSLVDGGVVNPVPVSVLKAMNIEKVIAVNVLAGLGNPQDKVEKLVMEVKKKKQREEYIKNANLFERMLHYVVSKTRPKLFRSDSILNVIMNSIQYMEYHMAEGSTMKGSVIMKPKIPIGAFSLEFYNPEKFISVGEEAAREKIDEMKALVAR